MEGSTEPPDCTTQDAACGRCQQGLCRALEWLRPQLDQDTDDAQADALAVARLGAQLQQLENDRLGRVGEVGRIEQRGLLLVGKAEERTPVGDHFGRGTIPPIDQVRDVAARVADLPRELGPGDPVGVENAQQDAAEARGDHPHKLVV